MEGRAPGVTPFLNKKAIRVPNRTDRPLMCLGILHLPEHHGHVSNTKQVSR